MRANMSPFKRKRAGQDSVDFKPKKGKLVPDEGKDLEEVGREKEHEITVPAPISQVRVIACYCPLNYFSWCANFSLPTTRYFTYLSITYSACSIR